MEIRNEITTFIKKEFKRKFKINLVKNLNKNRTITAKKQQRRGEN